MFEMMLERRFTVLFLTLVFLSGLFPGFHCSASAEESAKAKLETTGGLHITTFATSHGNINLYLPDDVSAGDTVSGVVRMKPAGDTDAEQQKNSSELSGYVVEIADRKTPVSEGWGKWLIPAASSFSVILKENGNEVARSEVPCLPERQHASRLAPLRPEDYETQMIGNVEKPGEVTGPFDGDLENSEILIGGKPVEILAESPGKLVYQNPADALGLTELTVENDLLISFKRPVRIVGVQLSITKSQLSRGEEATLSVAVLGLENLDQAVKGELKNKTPQVIDLKDEVFTIYPENVQTGGTSKLTRTVRGRQIGAFTITADLVSPTTHLGGVLFKGPEAEAMSDDKCAMISAEIDKAGEELEKKKKELEKAQGQLKDAKLDDWNCNQMRASLEKELKKAKKNLEDKERMLRSLIAQIGEDAARGSKTEQMYQNAQKKVDELEKKIKDCEDLKQKIKDMEKQIAGLQSEIDALKSQIEALEKQHEEWEKEVAQKTQTPPNPPVNPQPPPGNQGQPGPGEKLLDKPQPLDKDKLLHGIADPSVTQGLKQKMEEEGVCDKCGNAVRHLLQGVWTKHMEELGNKIIETFAEAGAEQAAEEAGGLLEKLYKAYDKAKKGADAIEEIKKRQAVQAIQVEGTEDNCPIIGMILYDPGTGLVQGIFRCLGTSCCHGTIIITYHADEHGVPKDEPRFQILNR